MVVSKEKKANHSSSKSKQVFHIKKDSILSKSNYSEIQSILTNELGIEFQVKKQKRDSQKINNSQLNSLVHFYHLIG